LCCTSSKPLATIEWEQSMTKWFLSSDKELVLESDGIKVRLWAVGGFAPVDVAVHYPLLKTTLAPFVLQEWTRYRLKVEMERAAGPISVHFGGDPAEHDPRAGVYEYTYRNQIGRSTITVTVGGCFLPPLNAQVLSPKLTLKDPDNPLFYPRFYRTLVDELVRYQRTLPFTFEAPTYHAVEETPEPPTLLFLFHFLRSRRVRELLEQAVEAILARPHRLLTAEEEFVPFHQVHEVDADVVLSILTNPQHWVRYQGAGLALAERLRGYAPQKVWQRLAVETFDTPENRFVKWFVGELLSWVEKLRAWERAPERARDEFVELKGQLERTLHDPLFDEVGEMVYFPATSQVLLKRSGYRELLELYRQYLSSKRPAFFRDLQEAIDSRDVATLYEYWCFFELVKRMEATLGKAKLQLKVREAGDLKWGVKASFGDTDYTLIYNRHFAHKKGSYSVPLRPDFALTKGDQARVVFDAKFRFEVKSLAEEGAEEDEYDMDVASGDVKRVVKHADLYKMHTYKDALGINLAVVLYPGTEERFYWEDEERREGIGAVPLLPEA
jgi:predicted component of viral defense system (DUF524 family)